MQISRPVETVFIELSEITAPYENVEDRLVSKTMNIPKLQFLASSLLSQPTCCGKYDQIAELIQVARNLDAELLSWSQCVPMTWHYSIATVLESSSDTEFIPLQIHRYPDFYTARVWNLYRVSRLIIQSIILRAISWLSTSTTIDRQDCDVASILSATKDMVNDICASVSFLFGHDLSKMQLPAEYKSLEKSATLLQQSMGKNNVTPQNGRFSLIWPLYIGCSVLSVPETQRKWMSAQLRRIAESGESQAELVSCLESQTLSGKVENFRFDCV